MRHQKTAKPKRSAYGSLKVERDFRDRLNTAIRDQGMTTTGAFRRFGDDIIRLIKNEQPASVEPVEA